MTDYREVFLNGLSSRKRTFRKHRFSSTSVEEQSVSEKSAMRALDYAVESERHGMALFFELKCSVALAKPQGRYNSSESEPKKEIPVTI
jgi:hypothetical protein